MPTPAPFAQTRWSLADLFPAPQSPELEDTFTRLTGLVGEFEKVRPQLSDEMDLQDFMGAVHQLEAINRLAYRLFSFANLLFAGDTQDQAAQSLMARVDQFGAELTNRLLFFSLWWKDLRPAAAARLAEGAGDFRYWLEEMRHYKPHTLSEPEEKIINIKNVTGSSALNVLYETITNRYTFKIEVNGEQKEVTRGELMSYVRQADPDLRARAYQELYRVYGYDAPILGQIYQGLVRDWRNENLGLRSYASPIAVRNLANDIPNEVVDALLEVARSNTSIFQRYFRLKARLLGLPRLRRYDLYAPVGGHSSKKFPYGQAAQIVLDSFYQFAPRLSELARKVFAENHLDSEVRRGKMGGAFCATAGPDLTPWVLLNYQGRPEDVATMAHELGHAIHSLLAGGHTVFTSQASLPLAETASTFGEMMLVDRLLADESDPSVRRDLLFKQLDDAYATILRQVFFALFEKQAHDLTAQGASVDELSAAYLENLKAQFGDAVEVGDEFRFEWVSIPHIYRTPFYVYAYAFGQLLVISLYQQFKAEGESFKPRYLKLLAAGGSQAPLQMLAEAGIDAYHASAFWQGGFNMLAEMVSKLEELA